MILANYLPFPRKSKASIRPPVAKVILKAPRDFLFLRPPATEVITLPPPPSSLTFSWCFLCGLVLWSFFPRNRFLPHYRQ